MYPPVQPFNPYVQPQQNYYDLSQPVYVPPPVYYPGGAPFDHMHQVGGHGGVGQVHYIDPMQHGGMPHHHRRRM